MGSSARVYANVSDRRWDTTMMGTMMLVDDDNDNDNNVDGDGATGDDDNDDGDDDQR